MRSWASLKARNKNGHVLHKYRNNFCGLQNSHSKSLEPSLNVSLSPTCSIIDNAALLSRLLEIGSCTSDGRALTASRTVCKALSDTPPMPTTCRNCSLDACAIASIQGEKLYQGVAPLEPRYRCNSRGTTKALAVGRPRDTRTTE